MPRVLVTGGTGVLGREVVRGLHERGAEALALSRRAGAIVPHAERTVQGDLATGEGLRPALTGADVVVHCATDPFDRSGRTDVEGTRRLIDAATAGGAAPHLVYISIVGVDAIPYRYYRAKLAAERLIVESGAPWTILRATQFHELVHTLLAQLARGPVALVPRGVSDQPVDAREVAVRLAELALSGPAGRVRDMGGPRVETAGELMRGYLAAIGRRRPVLAVPVPGKVFAGFRSGAHLAPEGDLGTRGFADYLRDNVAGRAGELPYAVRGRR